MLPHYEFGFLNQFSILSDSFQSFWMCGPLQFFNWSSNTFKNILWNNVQRPQIIWSHPSGYHRLSHCIYISNKPYYFSNKPYYICFTKYHKAPTSLQKFITHTDQNLILYLITGLLVFLFPDAGVCGVIILDWKRILLPDDIFLELMYHNQVTSQLSYNL